MGACLKETARRSTGDLAHSQARGDTPDVLQQPPRNALKQWLPSRAPQQWVSAIRSGIASFFHNWCFSAVS